MASRSRFSPIDPKFNDFLFAPVGEAGNGMTLNVMSALTRLNFDPWREAANLSKLSREEAIECLAPILARVPDAQWPLSDTRNIALRLIGLLPRHDAVGPSRATAAVGRGRPRPPKSRTIFLLVALAIVATIWFSNLSRQPPASGGTGISSSETSGISRP